MYAREKGAGLETSQINDIYQSDSCSSVWCAFGFFGNVAVMGRGWIALRDIVRHKRQHPRLGSYRQLTWTESDKVQVNLHEAFIGWHGPHDEGTGCVGVQPIRGVQAVVVQEKRSLIADC